MDAYLCQKMSPRHNFEKWGGRLSKRICRPQFSQKVNHAVGRESSGRARAVHMHLDGGIMCSARVGEWHLHVWKVAPRFGDYV